MKLRPIVPRVSTRPRVQPARGLPLPARILLMGAIAALGAITLFAWTGGIGNLVGSFGSSLSGILARVVVTATPTPPPLTVSRSPLIAAPAEPYTNLPSVDLTVTIPTATVGDATAKVRVYLALEGQSPSPIKEVPIGPTPKLVIPVDLTKGRNDFTATIITAGGESEASPVATYIFDTDPPVITLTAPKAGATVNASTVDLVGTVQARSKLLAHNDANGSSTTATAGNDGAFTLTLPLETGANAIKITATDPAGNPGELSVSVVRGTGTLTASLAASTYRLSAAALPTPIQLTSVVTNPDGQPLAGATVTFSLTLPKIPAITWDGKTGADGKVIFQTTVPKGVDVGTGLASVLVTTAAFGQTTQRAAITVGP